MKKHILLSLAVAGMLFSNCQRESAPQTSTQTQQTTAQSTPVKEKEYTYETVPDDSLKARIYTLDNGLKVYLSDYKNAPRIQTYIAVRAGSKNDPATATGLAHYLEHMVFKGTSKLGTKDWAKEKPLLDKIESLYNDYRATKDPAARKRIYAQIDSVSQIAAQYAIANEYDKVVSSIGTKNTNAYTYIDQTVYIGDIPSNQIERWAEIEAERFGELVPRLFHTELEAVYEEKNRALDSDMNKSYEALYAGLFPEHPYGTQTTIGTVEHLKNPSITEIKKYFDTYYVPNNFALALSGDMDMDQTIRIIDQHFGKLKNKPVPAWTSPGFKPLSAPVTKEIKGPDAEFVMIGYRGPGTKTRDALVMKMIGEILSNGKAGLIDLNLNQKQRVLDGYGWAELANDYSNVVLMGNAREGQKLEDVRKLLLDQVELVKQGKFDDWLMPAIVADQKNKQMKAYENNSRRADAFVSAYIAHMDWKDYVARDREFESITKQEVMEVANRLLNNNASVTVYKRTAKDTSIEKVEKPTITPVPVDRDASSEFFTNVLKGETPEVQPVFLDYKKDISEAKLKQNIPLYYLRNQENGLFSLYYVFDMGTNNDPKTGLAVQYLKYLGDNKFSAEELQKELYKIGASFDVYSSQDKIYVSLSGLDENMEKGLALFENLLKNPKADKKALDDMVAGILKERADAKLNKNIILQAALVNYAKYGPKNPFTNILSEKELKALKPEQLTAIIKNLNGYEHRVLYYGPRAQQNLVSALNTQHLVPAALKPVPAERKFTQVDFKENEVLWANYDMVQAEIMFLSKSMNFKPELVPTTRLFNEYFGGNMGSIVFQELRESRALAYSAMSRYSQASKKDEANYILSYIGTQADKLPEAMAGMQELLTEMPVAEANLTNAKASIRNNIATERITRTAILFDYENAKRLGIDYDIRRDIYQNTNNMTMAELTEFQKQYVKGQKQKILVIGNRDNLNFKELAKYGNVKEVSLKEIFGY